MDEENIGISTIFEWFILCNTCNVGEDNMGVEAEVLSSESILAALRQLRHDYEQ